MPEDVLTRVRVLTNDPLFKPENMMQKSVAAANLCSWATNIIEYHVIYKKVRTHDGAPLPLLCLPAA